MIDLATDAFRWWAFGGSPGAILLCIAGIYAAVRYRKASVPTEILLGLALVALSAIFMAGAVIPLATDGRVEFFTQDSIVFRSIMTFAWAAWGTFAWGIAVWLSRNRVSMIVASLSWLIVCAVAAERTMGLGL